MSVRLWQVMRCIPMGLVTACMLLEGASAWPFDRDAAMALARAAEAEVARGELGAAIATLRRAEAADPAWLELAVNRAALLSRLGDHRGAIEVARGVLAKDPSLAGARFNLGLAQFKSGEYAGAAETLARYRGDRSTPVSVHVALGLSAAALSRFAEAAAALGLAVEAGAEDPAVLYALARARREAGDAAGASAAAAHLRALAPHSAASAMVEGDDWDERHDWVRAEESYRRAVAADARFPGAHVSLGLMLYKRGAFTEAGQSFERELAQRPDDAPALRYRARLDLDAGNPKEALTRLERLALTPAAAVDDVRDLGRAQIAVGQFARAIETLRRAARLSPGHPGTHFLLSRALQADGHHEAAAREAQQATLLNRRVRERLQERLSPSDPVGVQ